MKFRNWLELDEINKGLQRTFIAQHPHLPQYVAKQTLYNRVAPLWKNVQAGQARTISPPTVSMDRSKAPPASAQVMDKNDVWTKPTAKHAQEFNKQHPTYNTPSTMYQDPAVSNLANKQNWPLETITVTPLDFDDETISLFLRHEFGSSPSLSKHVKNHDERMTVQNQIADKVQPGKNEPIIIIKKGDKYQMQEGWHRLYAMFLKANPEAKAQILSGQSNNVDLTKFRPITIQAYVGG